MRYLANAPTDQVASDRSRVGDAYDLASDSCDNLPNPPLSSRRHAPDGREISGTLLTKQNALEFEAQQGSAAAPGSTLVAPRSPSGS